MSQSRPKLIIVEGAWPQPPGLLSPFFDVASLPAAQLEQALRDPGEAFVLAPAWALRHLAPEGQYVWSEQLLNAIADGVCLARWTGEVLWANQPFRLLDPALRGQIAQSVVEAFAAAAQGAEGEIRISEASSADQAKAFELRVIPVPAAVMAPQAGAPDMAGRYAVVVVREITRERRWRQRMEAIDQAGGELIALEGEALRKANMIERLQMLEHKVVRHAHELLHFDHFAIRLLDPRSGKLELVIKHNLPPEYDAFDIYPRTEGHGISGWVAATGRSYICRDTANDPLFLPGLSGARSSLTVPLKMHDKVIGIMNVESLSPAAFDEADRQLAEIFARYVAIAIHTLDLLVVERVATNQALSGRVLGELAEPLSDICRQVELLGQSHPDMAASGQIGRIMADVESIRQRVRDMAQGPGALLGVERAMEDKRVDPLLQGRRVLVADDEPRVRRVIGDLLRNRGCIVEVCENGAQAIEHLQAAGRGVVPPFELVVSDIRMPDRNGYEVFAEARLSHPGVPVILMTGFGYDPSHSIVRASQEGLRSVLFKPFQVEQLLKIVKETLAGRPGS